MAAGQGEDVADRQKKGRVAHSRDKPVVQFLESFPEVERMYGDIYHFVASWLPDYARDNRNYLTVAIGCTGGRHRSVYLVERLALAFSPRYQVLTRHRESPLDDATIAA